MPGDEVLIGRFGYLFFEAAAKVAGAAPVRVRSRGAAFDPDAALEAITPRTRILFLDNPNNPTGSHLKAGALRELRCRLRDDILLVIDAAYAEYVTDPDFEAGAALVEETDNCVMLRTFRRIHGLAGFRVGWAYAPREVADVLHRVRQPNSLAGPSLAAAEAALGKPERLTPVSAENARLRDWFSQALGDLGLEVHPSQGNFVMVGIGHDARDVLHRH